MVHVYNEMANQDLQRRKSLKCKPVDIPVLLWRSIDNIITVLAKSQNILSTSSYLIALLELLTVLLEYIDLFSVNTCRFQHRSVILLVVISATLDAFRRPLC